MSRTRSARSRQPTVKSGPTRRWEGSGRGAWPPGKARSANPQPLRRLSWSMAPSRRRTPQAQSGERSREWSPLRWREALKKSGYAAQRLYRATRRHPTATKAAWTRRSCRERDSAGAADGTAAPLTTSPGQVPGCLTASDGTEPKCECPWFSLGCQGRVCTWDRHIEPAGQE